MAVTVCACPLPLDMQLLKQACQLAVRQTSLIHLQVHVHLTAAWFAHYQTRTCQEVAGVAGWFYDALNRVVADWQCYCSWFPHARVIPMHCTFHTVINIYQTCQTRISATVTAE